MIENNIKNKNKILLICYIPNSYSISSKRFKKLARALNKDSVVISFDLRSQRLLEEASIPFKRARSYLQENEIETLMSNAYEHLAHTWKAFISNNKNILDEDLITCLSASEIEYMFKTSNLIYLTKLIERVLDTEFPEKVVLIAEEGYIKNFTLELTKRKNYKEEVISLRKAFTLNDLYNQIYLLTKGFLSKFYLSGKRFTNNSHKKYKILFAGYYPVETKNNLIQLMETLTNLDYQVLFLSTEDYQDFDAYKEEKKLIQTLEKLNITYYKASKIKKLSNKISNALKKLESKIINELFTYKGMNLLSVDKKEWSTCFCNLEISIFEYFLNKEKPDIVLIPHDQSFWGYLITKTANQLNIPTIAFPAQSYQLSRFIPPLKPLSCNRVLVSGKAPKDYLIKSGWDSSKISISGTVKWDRLFAQQSRDNTKDKLYKKLNLPFTKDIWLFTTQGLPEENEKIKMLTSLMKNYLNKQLIIKLHPLENYFNYYLQAIFSKAKNVSIIKDIDLWDLIANCELLITSTSLTALEAMIFKKPVIVLDTDYTPYPWSYIKEEAVIAVKNKKDLKITIDKIINNKDFKEGLIYRGKKYTENYVSNLDEQATDKIVGIIEETIHKYNKLNERRE